MVKTHEFSETELLLTYEKKLRELLCRKEPSEKPRAVLLGGQPGSGKTMLQQKVTFCNELEVCTESADW